jgi:hypothetical protein
MADVLGEVYEQFLGKAIRLSPGLCRKHHQRLDTYVRFAYSTE